MTGAEQPTWEHFRKLVEARRSDQQFADSVTAKIITAMFAAGDAAIASLTAERDVLHRVIKGEITRASDATGLTAAIDDAGGPVLSNGGRFLTAPERIASIAAKFNAAVAEARDWEERANFNRARELEQAARADKAEAECAVWRREADAAAHAGLRAQERADKAEAECGRLLTETSGRLHDSEQGRTLLAEVARLREENAALKEQIEAVDHECKRQLETDRYKAGFGRAHAALSCVEEGVQEVRAILSKRETVAIIADHEAKAAGEYLKALEAEHEAVNVVHDEITRTREGVALLAAHAAVEALRGQ